MKAAAQTPGMLYRIYAWLLLLLGLTVACSFLELGIGNAALNLGIAAIKAGLIAWFFMRLRDAPYPLQLTAGLSLLWLLPLFWLTLLDILAR